jgi:hypothetical protein
MTEVFNVDVFKEASPLVVSISGVEHKMVPASVQVFLENIADLEKLEKNPTLKEQVEWTVRILTRAFPTIPAKEFHTWPLSAIESLFNKVRTHDDRAQVEETDAEGNEQAAR